MTYQPYPTGSAGNVVPQPGPQPSSVLNAVRLMYAGAALGVLGVIFTLAFSGRIKSAVGTAARKANVTRKSEGKSQLSASQIHSLETFTIEFLVAVLVIGVLLWVWMAWANGKGSGWARIVATVLFVLNTLYLVFVASRAGITAIFVGLSWVIGLVTIILLWRRESTEYINSQKMQ
jgi:ABC-type transport system involved in cytochrome bd biosynthesis fused ATPase/permease subunit